MAMNGGAGHRDQRQPYSATASTRVDGTCSWTTLIPNPRPRPRGPRGVGRRRGRPPSRASTASPWSAGALRPPSRGGVGDSLTATQRTGVSSLSVPWSSRNCSRGVRRIAPREGGTLTPRLLQAGPTPRRFRQSQEPSESLSIPARKFGGYSLTVDPVTTDRQPHPRGGQEPWLASTRISPGTSARHRDPRSPVACCRSAGPRPSLKGRQLPAGLRGAGQRRHR